MQMPEMAIFVFMAALIAGLWASVKATDDAPATGVAEISQPRASRPR
jgi:hypothetical protein